MKTFLQASILLLVFCGCRKEADIHYIAGKWELRTYANDITGHSYPEGNGNIYDFTLVEYKKHLNGTLYQTGNYRIIKDTTTNSFSPGSYMLVLSGQNEYPWIKIEGNVLILQTPRTYEKYVRIR
jgi:hypothetical protein